MRQYYGMIFSLRGPGMSLQEELQCRLPTEAEQQLRSSTPSGIGWCDCTSPAELFSEMERHSFLVCTGALKHLFGPVSGTYYTTITTTCLSVESTNI